MNRQKQKTDRRRERLLTLLLSLVLLFSAIPFSAHAADGQGTAITPPDGTVYRSQLPTKEAQVIYDMLAASMNDNTLRSGEWAIDLIKAGVYENRRYDESVLLSDFISARDAFFLDHPTLFYVDLSRLAITQLEKDNTYYIVLGAGGKAGYLADGFAKGSVEAAVHVLNTRLQEIAALANAEDHFRDKLSVAYREVMHAAVYQTAYEAELDKALHVDTAYGALVKGAATGDGYARALKAVLDELHIPSVLVTGVRLTADGSVPHTWNYVKAPDGRFYLLDAAADDALSSDESSRSFFMQHASSANAALYQADGALTLSPTSYRFRYPVLSDTAYNDGTASSAPHPIEFSPLPARFAQGESYTVTVTYSEALQKADPQKDVGIWVSNAPEGVAVSSFTWHEEDKCKVTFTFNTVSSSAYSTAYCFRLDNLVGEQSREEPHAVTLSVPSVPVYACPTAETAFYTASGDTPALLLTDDLVQNAWYDADGRKLTKAIPLQLSLLSSVPSAAVCASLEAAISGSGVAPTATRFYDLSLFLWDTPLSLTTGRKVKIFLPYPETAAKEGEKLIFRAYCLDESNALTELPSVMTEAGLIILCDSFGAVAVTASPADDASFRHTVLVTTRGSGNCYPPDEFFFFASKEGGHYVHLVPDDDYSIESVLLNGKQIYDAKQNKLPLLYSALEEEGNLVEIVFASTEQVDEMLDLGYKILVGNTPTSPDFIDGFSVGFDIIWPLLGVGAGILTLAIAVLLPKYFEKKRKK